MLVQCATTKHSFHRSSRRTRSAPSIVHYLGSTRGIYRYAHTCRKKNKVVNVLSTMHYTCLVDEQTEKRKPYAILDYNANKCGVDTMDQMLGTYSCKRATQRWPLAMFYNMLDVAALAAFTIYNEMKPIKRSDRRRSFLLLLTKQLATPNIEERALNNHITSYPRIRNAMEAFDVRVRKHLQIQE